MKGGSRSAGKVIFGTRFSGKMKFILENLKISRPGNNLNILLLQLPTMKLWRGLQSLAILQGCFYRVVRAYAEATPMR